MSIRDIPIVNESDSNWTRHLYQMWAGSYGSVNALVWANDFDSAFESFTEWLDDNAPGCLTTIGDSELAEAAAELGHAWPMAHDWDDPAFVAIVELAEQGYTSIGHTTLDNGTHIASHEWGGDEITNADDFNYVRIICKDFEVPTCSFSGMHGAYTLREALEFLATCKPAGEPDTYTETDGSGTYTLQASDRFKRRLNACLARGLHLVANIV